MQKQSALVFTHSSYSKYVKITPKVLIFDEAYDGKKYEQILEVQNCHDKLIEVVFGTPSSSALYVKTNKKVHQLCAGLKCSCKILYKHSTLSFFPQLILPIYINDITIDYKISVKISKPSIICEPYDLDFGTMNMNQVEKRTTVCLKNNGSQNTHFSIDFGINQLKIVIFPQKGIVQAKSKVTLQVDILGSREGPFDEEIWIKCNMPQRLRVFDFSNIYFKQEVNRYITIENYSSEPAMFCIIVDSVEPPGYFVDVRKTDAIYRNFNITPVQSRIAAKKKTILEFTFKPIKSNINVRSEYFTGIVKIIKLEYTDVKYPPFEEESHNETKEVSSSEHESMSTLSFGNSQGDDISVMSDSVLDDEIEENRYLNIFLHGEAESASITIKPIERSIIKTNIGETVRKNIIIMNDSKMLPITVESIRTVGVKIIPQKLFLKPEASANVYLDVTPRQMKFSGVIRFNLYNENDLVGECNYPIEYEGKIIEKSSEKRTIFNLGITPKVGDEVGRNCENIRYDTEYPLPRCAMSCLSQRKKLQHGSELIAFPNDRPRSLLPKAPTVKCTTIFASLPRFPRRDLDDIFFQNKDYIKKNNNKYYEEYLKSSALQRWKKNPKKNLQRGTNMQGIKVSHQGYAKKIEVVRSVSDKAFILSPMELANIKVSPKKLVIRNVVPSTDVRAIFTICNKNMFNIVARLQSDEMQIKVEYLGTTVVAGNTSKELGMIFNTARIGKKVITIECVLNESHIYKIMMIVFVVAKEVYVDKEEIVINPYDRNTNYLELKNKLNAPVDFKWVIEEPIFEILPQEACIPPERSILCNIEYLNAPHVSDSTFVTLHSEGGVEKYMKITYQSRSVSVGIDVKSIEFKSLPLSKVHIKNFTIRNFSSICASFTVNTPQPIYGINVTPVSGIIPKKGDQIFRVTAIFEVAIEFTCIISINIERYGDIDIDVKGKCILPKILITPNYINLRKIMPHSVDVSTFSIKNLTEDEISLEFCFNEYLTDFFVSSSMSESFKLKKLFLRRFETRMFYLHFHPTDVTIFAFFLPMISNGSIGPAVLNDPKSILYETFTKKSFRLYKEMSNVSLVSGPKYLECLKITSVVTQPFLKFSDFFMNFTFHHDTFYKSKNHTTFEVSNISNDKIMQFCIRTDELDYPFSFVHSEGKIVEVYNKSIHCILQPDETVIFNVRFEPNHKHFDTFVTNLPLYLKDFYECVAFNTIILKGTYPKSIITSNIKNNVVFYQPTILRQPSDIKIKLNVNYHFENCFVVGQLAPEFECHFQEGRRLECGKKIINVTITVCPTKVTEVHQLIIFECTCSNSRYTLNAHGCFENCIPTSYANLFWINHSTLSNALREDSISSVGRRSDSTVGSLDLMSYTNDTCFPLFPTDNDDSDYSNLMRRVHEIAEKWINTQGLYNSKYHTIPEGISANSIESFISTDGKKTSSNPNPPLVQILTNFGGREAQRYVCAARTTTCTDELQCVIQMHNTYALCLEFIRAQGGLLPHVTSEYLLSYKDFMTYRKYSDENLECEEDNWEQYFYRRSKQCYIDVILQVYKIFILNKIKPLFTKSQPNITLKLHTKSETIQFKYSSNERYLLKWAQRNYESHKNFWVYIPTKKDFIPKRFENFEIDFNDSLAIAAILITYCPFLKDDLKYMYSQPENISQLYHNANKVCQVWYTLKLSLEISCYNIVHSNIVEMLILINYLHDIIPNYLPNDTLILRANLTTTSERGVVVENLEDKTLTYHVMFFGNDISRFSSEIQIVTVAPRSTYLLQIKYYAKTVDTCNATLVLCGEYSGRKYSKTLSMNLVGISVTVEIPEVIIKTRKIYSVVNERLGFGKKKPGVYDLYYANNLEAETPELFRYNPKFALDVPTFEYYNSDKLIVNSEGDIVNDALMACCPTTTEVRKIIFGRNSESGDFLVIFLSSGTLTEKMVEHLKHKLPNNFENFVCTCDKKTTTTSFSNMCLRTQRIQIPQKNTIFFRAFFKYLSQILHPTEKQFCQLIKNQPVFTRIFKHFIELRIKRKEPYHLFDFFFRNVVNYRVKVLQKAPFQTIDVVTIPNVSEPGFVYIPVHINPDADLTKKLRIELTSTDLNGFETRMYSISFEA